MRTVSSGHLLVGRDDRGSRGLMVSHKDLKLKSPFGRPWWSQIERSHGEPWGPKVEASFQSAMMIAD